MSRDSAYRKGRTRPLYGVIAACLLVPSAGHLAAAEPPRIPLAEQAAPLERDIAAVKALAATRAAIASRLEAELGQLTRRLSAVRLGNAILAADNGRLTREMAESEERLRRLTRDTEAERGGYAALLEKYQACGLRAERLESRITALEERLAGKQADPEAVAAARARITELDKAYRTLLATHPRDAARKAALGSTLAALQQGQLDLARLTGARGVYTVQSGDSLERIARFFYRDAGRWRAIFQANAFLLGRPGHIAPGTVLLIPR
jgi:nucleoid-associated protein YgaU